MLFNSISLLLQQVFNTINLLFVLLFPSKKTISYEMMMAKIDELMASKTASKTSLSDERLRYVENDCYYNACANKPIYEKNTGKQLKVVIGSLGLNGHFEFGGKDWTANNFYENPLDSHAWLEDDAGNVYDYIFSGYGYCATHWGKEVSFPLNYEIVGMSKEELKSKYNLEYVKASRTIQKDIWKNALAKYKMTSMNKYKIIKSIVC